MTEIKPVAWRWTDKHGCVYITGDERRDDVPANASPLYGPEAMAEIERLRKTLEPFAVFGNLDLSGTVYEGKGDDAAILYDYKTDLCVTVGHFRDARAALASHASQSGVDAAPLPSNSVDDGNKADAAGKLRETEAERDQLREDLAMMTARAKGFEADADRYAATIRALKEKTP